MSKKFKGIEGFGIRIAYPDTVYSTISMVSIFGFVIALVFALAITNQDLTLDEKGLSIGSNIGLQIYSIKDGFSDHKLTPLAEKRQVQFMTPSLDSWEYKTSKMKFDEKSDKEKADFISKYGWENLKGSSAKLDSFAILIKEECFTKGWRRYEYEGKGREPAKGWWWTMTVKKDFDMERFIEFYLKFWNTEEIYIEELNTYADFTELKK